MKLYVLRCKDCRQSLQGVLADHPAKLLNPSLAGEKWDNHGPHIPLDSPREIVEKFYADHAGHQFEAAESEANLPFWKQMFNLLRQ